MEDISQPVQNDERFVVVADKKPVGKKVLLKLILGIVILFIGLIVYFFIDEAFIKKPDPAQQTSASVVPSASANTTPDPTPRGLSESTPIFVVAGDQKASNTIAIQQASINADAFIVIYMPVERTSKAIGHSKLLTTGVYDNLLIPIDATESAKPKAGDIIDIVVHYDNGNGAYDENDLAKAVRYANGSTVHRSIRLQ